MKLENVKIIGTYKIDLRGCLRSHTINKNLLLIKRMWNYLGNLSIWSLEKNKTTAINHINVNGIRERNSLDIANAFSDHF